MEIGYVNAEFGIFVCREDYEEDFLEPEIIYDDYKGHPLGDINYEWNCEFCTETFIGNSR